MSGILTDNLGRAGGLMKAAAAGGGWAFVSAVTASSSATVAFTNHASGYDYEYVFESIIPASDNVELRAEVGVAGPTYRTSGYQTSRTYISRDGTSVGVGSINGTIAHFALANGIGNTSTEGINRFVVMLSDPANSGNYTQLNAQGTIEDTGGDVNNSMAGGKYHSTAEANTAIKFYFSSGNVASGTITQYRRSLS